MKFFKEMRKYWRFAVYAAKSDLQAEVADSYLNWLWWIIEPLSAMLIYTLVFGVVFKSNEMYFPLFIFLGLTVWDFFSRCVTSSVNLIRGNQHIISKIYLPKHILLVQRMLVLAFKMLVCWILVVTMMIWYHVPVGINLLYFLPILAVFFTFCFAVSLYFIHFGVYVSDLSNLIGIVLNLMFYVTGIFYNVQKSFPAPFGYLAQRLNPVAHLIFSFRKVLLYNERPSCAMLVIWFMISVALAAGGLRLIYRNENNYVKMI
ncbi:MAG: ABC transporter permease [Lachnospiraceae bacterium]|nr:ABC transporter permease [Lachnospiraceae bacterium]